MNGIDNLGFVGDEEASSGSGCFKVTGPLPPDRPPAPVKKDKSWRPIFEPPRIERDYNLRSRRADRVSFELPGCVRCTRVVVITLKAVPAQPHRQTAHSSTAEYQVSRPVTPTISFTAQPSRQRAPSTSGAETELSRANTPISSVAAIPSTETAPPTSSAGETNFSSAALQWPSARPSIHRGMSSRATSAEEAALLSVHRPERPDELELRNIPLFPSLLQAVGTGCIESYVQTDRGSILVATQGDRSKPAIITYHDLGLNYKSFVKFFKYVDNQALLQNFCVYHVTAPGQEEGAATLPKDYSYPTMDELATQISFVLTHFRINTFIGFGVGAGANVLARFAFANPNIVDALMLVNCTATQEGWLDWLSHKLMMKDLHLGGMVPTVVEFLLNHSLGRNAEERNPTLTALYKNQFARDCNADNLWLLLQSYFARTDLGISRETATIRTPVVNMVGAHSPALKDSVAFNARLDPTRSSWMKMSESAMPLEEQPDRVSEAFRLFLQGEGYVAPLSPTKIVAFRRLSDAGRRRACRHSPVIRITENPISEACSAAC